MSDPRKFDPASAYYTPAETSSYGLQAVEKIENGSFESVDLGIPGMGGYLAPMLPGQVLVLEAQTSNFKSGSLRAIEKWTGDFFIREERTKERVVHVTLEEPIEELAFHELALLSKSGEEPGKLAQGIVKDWGALRMASIEIAGLPMMWIGNSLARARDYPNLYLTNIEKAIYRMVDDLKIKVGLLVLDYLHALPIDPEVKHQGLDVTSQRRIQVREDFYRFKQIMANLNCPGVIGAQSKAKLDGAPGPNMLIPGMYDIRESTEVSDRTDRLVAQWMPKVTHTSGKSITHGDMTFKVEDNILWMRVLKQRMGLPAGKTWKMRINFATGLFAPELAVEESSLMTPGQNRGYNETGYENQNDDVI